MSFLTTIYEVLADTGSTYIIVSEDGPHIGKKQRYKFEMIMVSGGNIHISPIFNDEWNGDEVRIATLEALVALHKRAIRAIEDYVSPLARSVLN